MIRCTDSAARRCCVASFGSVRGGAMRLSLLQRQISSKSFTPSSTRPGLATNVLSLKFRQLATSVGSR